MSEKSPQKSDGQKPTPDQTTEVKPATEELVILL